MRYLLVIICLFTGSVFAQDTIISEMPAVDGQINFNEVVQIDSASAADLYLRAKSFFVEQFKSAKDVIQMDDKEAGILIGKGWNDIYVQSLGMSVKIQFWYTIKIQAKEGRYKYEIYDLKYTSYSSQYTESTTRPAEEVFYKVSYYKKNGQPKAINQSYKDQTLKSIESTIATIKTAMLKKTSVSKGSDW